MSSNVNLLSVGAGSTAKVSVKASVKTASSQGSDFSKTLDQAQQARSRDTAKPESDYKSVAKDESTKAEQPEATKPEAADSKAKADAAYKIQLEEQRKTLEITTANANIAKQEKEVEIRRKEVEVQEQTLDAQIKKSTIF